MTQMLELQKKDMSEEMKTLNRMETIGGGNLMENVGLKNAKSEMKNSLDASNSRLDYRRNDL